MSSKNRPKTKRFGHRPKSSFKVPETRNVPQNENNVQKETNEESEEDRFERELAWCVDQLELGLEKQNPDSRQATEACRILRILQSDKAPLIKKRQAMRNTFGDYRQKMKAEGKKQAAKMRKLAVTSGEKSIDCKSVCYRKKVWPSTSHQEHHFLTKDSVPNSDSNSSENIEHVDQEDFKFNFEKFSLDTLITEEDGMKSVQPAVASCSDSGTFVSKEIANYFTTHSEKDNFMFDFSLSKE